MASRRARPSPEDERRTDGAPVRTCVGCRARTLAADMVRVVARPGDGRSQWVIVPDLRRGMAGRGAWVHPDRDCVATAVRRRAFARALRVVGEVDTRELDRMFTSPTDTEESRDPSHDENGQTN
ncbi:YlxR family protein [Millisia brevis]|uniref:YlxR family protein n=1 Tax=Millisia brevis TaxID=264148 RepID=UPI003F729CDB